MADHLLEQLKTMDPTVVTEVVRKDRRDPFRTIQDWTVEPLGGGGGAKSIFRLRGLSADDPWVFVAKFFERPAGQDDPNDETPSWWNNGIRVFETGELDRLPPGMRAPRVYGSMKGQQGDWLWMENLEDISPKHWTLDYFQRTARLLGRFGAAYLCGTPLPSQPWLHQNLIHDSWDDSSALYQMMNPASETSSWNVPLVQAIFNDARKANILRLFEDRALFVNANDRLPRVFCHNDAQRRNFLWVNSFQSREDELVAVDWDFCGVGALGNDLGELVANSMWFFEYNPDEAETFERALMESYMAGVADQNVEIDPRLVRLGYLISVSHWMGLGIVLLVHVQVPPDLIGVIPLFGRTREEMQPGWLRLNDFALERAGEARSLMRQLNL